MFRNGLSRQGKREWNRNRKVRKKLVYRTKGEKWVRKGRGPKIYTITASLPDSRHMRTFTVGEIATPSPRRKKMEKSGVCAGDSPSPISSTWLISCKALHMHMQLYVIPASHSLTCFSENSPSDYSCRGVSHEGRPWLFTLLSDN